MNTKRGWTDIESLGLEVASHFTNYEATMAVVERSPFSSPSREFQIHLMAAILGGPFTARQMQDSSRLSLAAIYQGAQKLVEMRLLEEVPVLSGGKQWQINHAALYELPRQGFHLEE